MNSKRLIYIDIIKVFSAFLIVMQHSLALEWAEHINPYDIQWKIINLVFIISRMGVPLFFMCSGATMFLRKHSIKEIYCSSIPRIIIPYIFWMLVYGGIEAVHSSSIPIAINSIIKAVIFGRYHTWFIAALLGLYFITPLIQEFIYDTNLLKYAIILSILFTVLLPYSRFIGDERLETVINDFKMHFVVGYILYYLLGYYLGNIIINAKHIYIYCITILTTLLASQLLCVKNAVMLGAEIQNIFSDFSIIGVLLSASIFLSIRCITDCLKSSKKDITAKRHNSNHLSISHLASLGIGIYLAHPLFLPLIEPLHGLMRFWGILIIYSCSMTISFIISKTPLKKLFL
ncbi:acyltransferase [Butyrivibrio fibrisolvens]|uniref:acyltransferase n=1 Tax=Butyrivibrio fibrisolvens TaxID=831 RepID=UPI00041F19F0|nr:acyltransferase [Butyrivibrio fibrisolvens]